MSEPVRLEGELESHPLREIVPLLAERRASGVLRLQRGPLRRWFDLSGGAVIRASSSDPREYFGQLLVDQGLLSSNAAAHAFWFQEATRVMVGKLLPMRGSVAEERVREVLELKVREAFFDCYRWEQGELVVEPGEPAAARGVEISIPLARLHCEALERAREQRRLNAMFPSPAARLRTREDEPPASLPPDELVLFELAHEGATIAEALEAFRDGDFQVYRRLAALVAKGLIEIEREEGPPPDKRALARLQLETSERLLARGRPREAAGLAARAAEHTPSREALRVLGEAQAQLTLQLADELLSIEGAPGIKASRRELEKLDLQPAERYLLLRISATRNLRETVRDAPMGELQALLILQRLVQAGVIIFARSAARKARRPAT